MYCVDFGEWGMGVYVDVGVIIIVWKLLMFVSVGLVMI